MKILVLGGTQFIGLRLVDLLVRQSHEVTVLNRGVTVATLPESVERLTADRSKPETVLAALRGRTFDVVMDIFAFDPAEVQPVLDALTGNFAQYILCGSVGYYQPGETFPIDESHPVIEDADKILSEKLLMEACSRGEFAATVIRPPVVYGPHNPIVNREASYFAQLSRGRPIILGGDGTLAVLHSVHVDDVASAFALAAGNEAAAGQIFNIADSLAYTHKGYIETIAEAMGVPLELVCTGDPTQLDERFAHMRNLFPFGGAGFASYNTEKIRDSLGWKPQYSLLDGMRMTYQWWLSEGLDKLEQDYDLHDELLALLRGSG
jgi:nucleoside-diphosphate-sugar epimerase